MTKNEMNDHKQMDHSQMDHSKMDHSQIDHSQMDHSQMDHSQMDHSKMDHSKMDHSQMDHSKMDHSQMDHSMMGHDMAGMNHDMDEMDGDMMMHGGHMMHMGNLKKKFWISVIMAIPVLLLSQIMGFSRAVIPAFPGSEWLVLVSATVLFFYGGWTFINAAYYELKEKKPAMMTLISLGISVSYFYSVYAFIARNFLDNHHVMDFFTELATLILIMLLGHWIEMNAMMKAGNALEKMAQLLPSQAHVQVTTGEVVERPLAQIKINDLLIVRGGESIPADGTIINGQSQVNESLVTGESKAINKEVGATVIGGSVNGDGTLTIKVTGTGESGYLSQVMKLIGRAQNDKSKSETMADKVAGWLFYFALVAGILTFVVWGFNADMATALERMVAVLVIACPHALGVAVPLVVARSTSLAAVNGLLIQERQALENAKTITHVFLDKTGTLTEGNFTLNAVHSYQADLSDDQALQLIGGLEQHSSHPIATGVLSAVKKAQLTLPEATDVQTIKGVGLAGTIDARDYQIVTVNYLQQHQLAFDQAAFTTLADQGNSVSYLISGQQVLAIFAAGDQIKDSARSFIKALQARGITPVMLTGDNQATAAKVAASLGITEFKAHLLPEDKEKVVREYQAAGHHVMMVGDGVNDAPALVRADIGVAIGAGTDVAIDAADVILVHSDPADILNFLNLAQATNRKMIENLWWGAGYNLIAIPLAAGVLAPIGFVLSPAIGAIIMSFSTVIVALNAMSLRLKRA
ncbi:heavy metal translocating P-type ATPase [Lapidilactobacillus achengensis]|uniref:P-type Cu(+) transporter n=1 Tax=Lapidilactobacillus achengensis TaxID=2486000 RepID=A0ABW1UJQ2_9LACO